MSCKPTYKGKRYNSLEEIKEVIKKEYPHKDGIKIDELPINNSNELTQQELNKLLKNGEITKKCD